MNRFDLYEWAVQAPAMQARFLRVVHAGGARVLREDFAGPAAIARAWVLLDDSHRAVAIHPVQRVSAGPAPEGAGSAPVCRADPRCPSPPTPASPVR